MGRIPNALQVALKSSKDGLTAEEFDKPTTLSGEPVLPGFECNLERIWDPSY